MRTKDKDLKYAAIFFALVLAKYLLFGFRYFPVLDDFIQYGGYPLYGDLSYVYFGIGTMAARPLASLLDPVFWGSMWDNMGLALLIISTLHFLAVFLLYKTACRCGARLSPLFLIISLFLPVGAEGAYWISASSRLVVGLFFSALSLYFLARFMSGDRKRDGILFAVFHVISYGFYEAVCIFGFLGVFLIALRFKNELKRRWWVLVLPVISMICLLAYYAWGSSLGALGSRAGGFTLSGLFPKLKDAAGQLLRVFVGGMWLSGVKGFSSGLHVAASRGIFGALWLLLVGAVCLMLRSAALKHEEQQKPQWWLLLCGLVLFLAPLVPNILVETVWLPYRTVFVSIIGLALLVEPLFAFALRSKRLMAAALAIALFSCVVANLNSYDTYRRVSERDVKIAQNIAEQLTDEVLRGEKNAVVVMGKQKEIYQVDFYKDYVKSVTDADWSLTGAVRAVTKNINIKKITPVKKGEEQVTDEQVLFMNADGHITDITEKYRNTEE